MLAAPSSISNMPEWPEACALRLSLKQSLHRPCAAPSSNDEREACADNLTVQNSHGKA